MNDPQWLETDKRLTQKGEDYGVGNSLVKALKRAHAHVEELREMVDGLSRADCDGCGKGGGCYDCDTGIQQSAGMCLLTVQRPPEAT